MSSPAISIVTPSLNQAEYLEETLTSVLGQGFESLEYVVIDGGSSDGSVEIVKGGFYRSMQHRVWSCVEREVG